VGFRIIRYIDIDIDMHFSLVLHYFFFKHSSALLLRLHLLTSALFSMFSIANVQLANAILEERLKDKANSSSDGFYESRKEWMGRRHFLLAFEG